MAERDPFETRFADAYARYLEDAPLELDAAELARSIGREHPRTRVVASVGGYRFAPRLVWLLLAAALLASLGVGALVAGARLVPSIELTPTEVPALEAPTMAPNGSVPVARLGSSFTLADLAGTWTGDVTAPGVYDSGNSDPSRDTTFATALTIGACTPGATCGSVSYATQDLSATGKTMSCVGTLKYRGPYESGPAFAFEEAITSRSGAVTLSQPQACSDNILVLTPLASGATVGVEEKLGGDVWADYGVLVKSATP